MKLNEYIDHTNLKNTSVSDDIKKLCQEATKYNFASVCVHPYYVKLAKELLSESNVKVCTVIGFPQGMNTVDTKVYETLDAIKNGADEIDMVINIAALKNKDYDYVKNELIAMRNATVDKVLKVIVETCLLTPAEIKLMTSLCNETGVDYIKTSTGFSDYGARIEDVKIMAENRNDKLQIKASGGIRDLETMKKMIASGATRIGTSSGVKIMEESEE